MMAFFEHDTHIRINKELIVKIDEILLANPDKFDSQSQVFRAGINKIWRQEVLECGKGTG